MALKEVFQNKVVNSCACGSVVIAGFAVASLVVLPVCIDSVAKGFENVPRIISQQLAQINPANRMHP